MHAEPPPSPAPPQAPREGNGRSVIEHGNTDIECGWEPPASTERAPLPGHEHLIGVEYEPLPKAGAWLTERRADLLFLALAAVGVYLGVGA